MPNRDPSIENEPQMGEGDFAPDPSEAGATGAGRTADKVPEHERVEHTVWDEPGISPALAGATPDDSLTYSSWLDRRIADTSPAKSWATVLLVAVAAGPWAILGAIFTGWQTVFDLVAITVFGPLAEEVMKIAVALWVVEKRLFLFQSRIQIAICTVAAGLAFATIENFMYLNVYIPDPPPEIVTWRWTVCMALHSGCSFIAGLGLMRVWHHAITHRTRPELTLCAPFLIAAVVVHGLYNGFAVLLQFSDYHF